jgi:2-succinyl-5-enolpyruvyl-6-hydroxy-3-cyclohexene-1-carboxylate synthase
METTAANINQLWANLIIEELTRQGITEFCLSPGSRNTPLAVAAARHDQTDCHVHFDERGAAFRALGYAKATGKPAVLICTSGTAGANYYPAVIETWHSRAPMLILTANRPPELWDCGANQTIDQTHLFGRFTRWFQRLSCPTVEIDPAYVLSTVDQALRLALSTPAGPVHIDCPFREPLAPINDPVDFTDYLLPIGAWLTGSAPSTSFADSTMPAQHTTLESIALELNQSTRGLLVVGRLDRARQVSSLVQLAGRLNWPVIADIQSGLRTSHALPQLIAYADLILSFRSGEPEPVTVLHIGDQPTSKRLHRYLSRIPLERYVHVVSHDRGSDPNSIVTDRIVMDTGTFCDLMLPLVSGPKDTQWLDSWRSQSARVADSLESELDTSPTLTEPLAARLVARHAPENTGLWVASSMPIRDLDSFAAPDNAPLSVGANRGASGIDGAIASACGFAAGLKAPVTALIGDLAALHDLNSLTMVAQSSQPVVIVILNNNGGGIFHFLPVAACDDVFERCFAAGHGFTFADAARQFGLSYQAPTTPEQFTTNLTRLYSEKASGIIEVPTDRRENHAHHLALIAAVQQRLQTG